MNIKLSNLFRSKPKINIVIAVQPYNTMGMLYCCPRL